MAIKVTLVAFGKLKTPGFKDTADYFLKLLRPWAALEQIELKSIPFTEKSISIRKNIQEKEASILINRLEKHCSKRAKIILIDEYAPSYPTKKWADYINNWEGAGFSEIVFCLGSSLGFAESLRQKYRDAIGLGPQTLSHELARVVLLEQLYRAFSITRNHPYHNEGS